MWTSRSLGMHDKPVVVLDPDGLLRPALDVPGVAARPRLRPAGRAGRCCTGCARSTRRSPPEPLSAASSCNVCAGCRRRAAGSASAARSRRRPAAPVPSSSRNICLSTRIPPGCCAATCSASSSGDRLGLRGRRGALQQAERVRLGRRRSTRPVQHEVLRPGDADQRRQPGRPDRHAEPRAGPRQLQVVAADAQVARRRRSRRPAPTQLPTATAMIGTGNSSSHAYRRVNAAIRATPPSWSSSSPTSAPAHRAAVSVVESTSARRSVVRGQLVERVVEQRAGSPSRARCAWPGRLSRTIAIAVGLAFEQHGVGHAGQSTTPRGRAGP